MAALFDDRYEIGDVLGSGGAARVHRAVDTRLDRDVAIKLLDDELARSTDRAAHERFVRESQTAARVLHPNLVTVFDAGEADGRLYIVMELVPGGTLADRIAAFAPLDVSEAVGIAEQVLDGLGAVHDAGIVHRDIKPGNILLGPGDRVRVTDFGIARELDRIGQQVTAEGLVMGTPRFLAPEQAMGGEPTIATDIYAVGLVLDEMLTARRTRGAALDSGQAAVAAAGADRFDPRDLRPDVPDRIASAVMRATDPCPDDRFGTAAEFGQALASCRESNDQPTTAMAPLGDPVTETVALGAVPMEPPRETSRPMVPAVLTVSAVAAVLLVVAAIVAFGGSGVDRVEGATDVDTGLIGDADAEKTFDGTTLDGDVVALTPTPAVPFDDGVPVAIRSMNEIAERRECTDVIAERDRWVAELGEQRYGAAASVFAQHAHNLATILGCDPEPVVVGG